MPSDNEARRLSDDEPSLPAEFKAREREMKAVEVWFRTRKEGEVRKALKLASNADARELISRGERRYWAERTENLDDIRGSSLNELDQMSVQLWESLREDLDVNDRNAVIDRALKVNEQRRRLTGADVVREGDGQGVTFNINTELPADVLAESGVVDEDDPPALEEPTD